MKTFKVWPHLTIVAILCALVAGLGVAFLLKHEQTVSAEALPDAARIQRVDGEAALSNGTVNEANDGSGGQWVAATPNHPFSVGDRIYTRDNSRASLAFSGRNFARLNPNTSLDLLSLNDRRTQLALRDGSAIFDIGQLAPGELFEVGTPYGAVDFDQPGLYDIGLDDNNGSAIVSVLSGLAQVVGLGGRGQIGRGEMLTLVGQTAANLVLSRLDGRNAGYLVDDYYSYQYPRVYDGRYRDYAVYSNDPYYYDPYRRNLSYQYVTAIIPGVNDLDYYGDWQNISGYGYSWRPRVDSNWAPYQQGYWINDYGYGPTWVSSEPWGYAPYHYGRWAYVGNQWYWIPDAVNTTPRYSPALVAFVPLNANEIGWVPLGPGDPYAPRYYDANWQPHYLTRTEVIQQQVVNLNVPGAVTVVSVQDFNRIVDSKSFKKANPQVLAQVRPVLDPLTLTPLRNAVLHSAWGRGKIDLPPGIAKKLYNTSVVTSAAPFAPPFRKDFAKALRVESVPEKAKNQKLKFRDERHGDEARRPNQAAGEISAPKADEGRKKQEAAFATAAARGKDAQRQMRQLEQQQKQEQANQQRMQERLERKIKQQPQGERVALPAQQPHPRQQKAERKAVQQPQGERVSLPAQQPHPRQQKSERKVVQQAQGERVALPAAQQPRPQKQKAEPKAVQQPHLERVAQPAAQQPHPQKQKAERKQEQPAQPAAANEPSKGQEGKGKGRKP